MQSKSSRRLCRGDFLPSLWFSEGVDKHSGAHVCLVVGLGKFHRWAHTLTSDILVLTLQQTTQTLQCTDGPENENIGSLEVRDGSLSRDTPEQIILEVQIINSQMVLW